MSASTNASIVLVSWPVNDSRVLGIGGKTLVLADLSPRELRQPTAASHAAEARLAAIVFNPLVRPISQWPRETPETGF